MDTLTIPRPRKRAFLPEEFKVTVWSKLKPYFNELVNREIASCEALECWLLDWSELDAVIAESFAWRYIKVSVNSSDQKAAELYQYAVQELAPKIDGFEDQLNHKLLASSFVDRLDPEKYFTHIRGVKNAMSLFRQENVDLSTAVQMKSKAYVKLFSEMTIGVNGNQMTLNKASSLLEAGDRAHREVVYHKIHQKLMGHTEELDDLFDELLAIRHEIALNAGFDNYRDYKFQSLGRFDYTAQDCFDFHESIKREILPMVDALNEYRKSSLGLDTLRPWDLHVDPIGGEPLKPFRDVEELVDKSAVCLSKLNPLFGEVVEMMREMGHLDLEARPGKKPGGYNMPLMMTGVPFVFMNASQSLSDLRTFMHESGHAIHAFLIRDYKIRTVKRVPSEVSELAAMSMELLSMGHWDVFFPKGEDLKRAKFYQLEYVLKVLPWIAIIDKFQHWLYTHPGHSREERKVEWKRIFREFNSGLVDHSELDHYLDHLWHKQLHIFEVPFYYIEYGLAQLGAIAIWKRFMQQPDQAIKDYMGALQLGYSKPIKEIYARAGIRFDFSPAYVSEIVSFVKDQLQQLLDD
jgi:oligoendopeptidase F